MQKGLFRYYLVLDEDERKIATFEMGEEDELIQFVKNTPEAIYVDLKELNSQATGLSAKPKYAYFLVWERDIDPIEDLEEFKSNTTTESLSEVMEGCSKKELTEAHRDDPEVKELVDEIEKDKEKLNNLGIELEEAMDKTFTCVIYLDTPGWGEKELTREPAFTSKEAAEEWGKIVVEEYKEEYDSEYEDVIYKVFPDTKASIKEELLKEYTTYWFGEEEYPSKTVDHGEYDPHTGRFEDGTTYDDLTDDDFKDAEEIVGGWREWEPEEEVEKTDEYKIMKGTVTIHTTTNTGKELEPKVKPDRYFVYFAKHAQLPNGDWYNTGKYKEHDIYFDSLEAARECVKDYGKVLKDNPGQTGIEKQLNESYIIADKKALDIIRSDKEYGKPYAVRGYTPDFKDIPNGTVIEVRGINRWHPDCKYVYTKMGDDEWEFVYYYGDGQWEPLIITNQELVHKIADLDRQALEEDIEKHDTLNPKLFDGEELKPEVKETIENIADEFIKELEADRISFDLKDIVLIGSNVSFNYTKDSDLDIHLVADSSNLHCPDDLYPLLYSAYRSMFNKNYDIRIKGIPAEIYVELDNIQANSKGMYSLKHGWLKKPVPEDVPEIDREAFEKLFQEWEDKYFELIDDKETELAEEEFPLDEAYNNKLYGLFADRYTVLSDRFIDHFDGGRPLKTGTYNEMKSYRRAYEDSWNNDSLAKYHFKFSIQEL